MRVPALQICPELLNTAIAAPGTAASISASANTTSGDLPPSSSCRRLRLPAEALTISCPVKCEPVNATLSTSGCAASAAPAVSPYPGTTFTTPGGTPASRQSSARRSGDGGASSAGFSTTVQPVASAGPIFQIDAVSGPFHGMMAPTTPTGSFNVNDTYSPGSELLIVSPCSDVAMPA